MRDGKNTDEFETSNALPYVDIIGIKPQVDEAFEKWKVKQANKKPKFKWVNEKGNNK